MANIIKLDYIESLGIDQKGKKTKLPKPFIQLVVQYKHSRLWNTFALVDSGADYNLFPGQVCKYFGINLTKGIEVPVYGIGNRSPITAYRHWGIKICFSEVTIETYADFASEQEHVLLGQNGFFDKFRQITFNRKNEKLEFVTF